MTVDEAVTNYFEDHREYTTGRKSYSFPGVGCVATWGERVGHRIGHFLDSQNINANTHSIEDLKNNVWQYLTQEYQPQEYDLNNVGYHVAGFDQDGQARFFEVVWGPKSRVSQDHDEREYQLYDCSPEPDTLRLSYGGRFGIAHTMVNLFFQEMSSDGDVRYDCSKPSGLVQFNDFVARFAGELTPEVGPPFTTYLMTPEKTESIRNATFQPLDKEDIMQKLIEIQLEEG